MRRVPLVMSVVGATALLAGGVFLVQIVQTKARLQAELETSMTRASVLTTSLADKSRENDALTAQVHDLDTRLGATKRDLTETKLNSDQLRQALELAEAARDTATANADQAQRERATLNADLNDARQQLAQAVAPATAARYRSTIAELEGRVAELEETLAHLPAPDTLVAGRSNYAQVVSVGPQNAFVIINFGTRHGALPNQRLQVKRGADSMALVEISETRENYSVAQVLPDSLSGKLRQGDAATLIP